MLTQSATLHNCLCNTASAPSGPSTLGDISYYDALMRHPAPAPVHWAASYTHKELSLHQLSPYIGKLKSVIARDLIQQYTTLDNLVVDPFCGSGTIPLEAASLRRRVFASDASPYAVTLTKAKLSPPQSIQNALAELHRISYHVDKIPLPSLVHVPFWVRSFFHERTLKETIRLADYLRRHRNYFFLAALLGILHHQRPGFLSYPSSGLVPYLRTKKFPRDQFPNLYDYRPIFPRLKQKLDRSLRRLPDFPIQQYVYSIRKAYVENITLPDNIDCLITSPPYMNALDYIRDNRLRLWFLDNLALQQNEIATNKLPGFQRAISDLASKIESKTKRGARCIFIVGESTSRNHTDYPSRELASAFLQSTHTFRLESITRDYIPDVRRARRQFSAVKQENILVFRKF